MVIRLVAAVPAALLMASSAMAAADCREPLLPGAAMAFRDITARDLVALRDFGRSDTALGGEAPFSIAPDGRSLALALRRGDPDTDRYCIGIMVVPIRGHGAMRLVDRGGDFILARSDVRGIPDLPIGTEQPVTPAWSPDGTWLAYLRRDDGITQAWRARADGTGATMVTHGAEDIRAVRWSADGAALIVTTRPGIAAGEARIEAEGRRGYLYDRRFWTLSQARPKPPMPVPFVEARIDPASGDPIDLSVAEPIAPPKPAGARLFAASPRGDRAWTSPVDAGQVLGPVSLKVEIGGELRACATEACADGVGALWWRDPGELLFMQGAEPENGGAVSVYRWRPDREHAPVLLLRTNDALLGCQLLARDLICARETATHPRVIVRLDPDTGRSTTLFDPNPEFGQLRMGQVERLRWTDPKGIAGYGDLVLPPTHRPGQRHPLVIVQYQSRGFLRGGTGDEYPIHVLAARGFAVLSFQRVRPFATGAGATDINSFQRIGMEAFAERRRMLSAVETGVRLSIAKGVIDPDRIGISGISDGAATVMFALNNSTLFRVAAMGSCCDDPSTSRFASGLGYLDGVLAWGYPSPNADDPTFWRQYSLAANAATLRTPILLQLTDDEYRFGLETYVTLDLARVPIDLYVFPDEYHVKWHPAHRAAAYERGIDWFDFWLNGREDADPAKRPQYDRWRALASRRR